MTTLHPGMIIRRDYMEQQEVGPAAMAERVGVDVSTMCRVLSGKSNVTVGMAFKLASALGETPKYWLDLQTDYNIAMWGRKE